MATVSLTVGGRVYQVGCRDGGEDHLRSVAALLDAKVAEAARAMGALDEARQLLLGGLLLADQLNEQTQRPPPAPVGTLPPGLATALENLADRIERAATQLEQTPPAS